MTVDRPALALVSPQWLASNLGNASLVILDATVPYGPDGPDGLLGRARWAEGHIPGARYADLQAGLSDRASPFGFTFPDPELLVDALQALGIDDNSHVVVYDDFLNMWATRIWWMLRAIGFDRASVLDGGWKAWRHHGLPVSKAPTPEPAAPGRLTVKKRPLFSGLDHVLAWSKAPQQTEALVCALPESYFNGADKIGGRSGHIPGSINIPAASLLDADGRFLPVETLQARLQRLEQASSISIYCGGGISATLVAFALALIGRNDVVVYDGSLEEWNSDPSRPLAGEAAA